MDEAIARLAARQHGCFSRKQALGAGMTDRMIVRRLSSGRWESVAAGVYRLPGVPDTWKQRASAACLASGPGAVVSHRSAAVLWGISGFRPGRMEITVPAGRGSRNPLARVHRSRSIERARRGGIPVTPVARTVGDLAGAVGDALLEEAVDDVLCRRLCRLDQLTALAGRRRSRALRAVLEAWNGDALPAGVAEMRVVRELLAAGLPQPVRQYDIVHEGVFVARVDLAYPDDRVAMELDGFRWHAGRGPFRSDRLRRNRIEAAGWRLLETAHEDIAALVLSAGALLKRAA